LVPDRWSKIHVRWLVGVIISLHIGRALLG
jgi:hypothetical protein